MYDAVVIGARCAGAVTAMLRARKGYKILLLDKAHFPSDIPHGHFIHRHGPPLLNRWGLLDTIVRSNCQPVTSQTIDLGDFPLTGNDLIRNDVALGYGPRRRVLDRILIDAAVAAGAEFRPSFVVDEYLGDGTTITGIRGRDSGERRATPGARIEERARITIGADGRNSSLARAVNAPVYEATPALTCWYFSYWGGVDVKGLEVYVRPGKVIFAFPTNDGLTAIFIGWALSAFHQVRSNMAASFLETLALVPNLAERVQSGERAERFYGAADLPNFFRKPYGSGWALVGDAGCHKDPFLALGICDALRDAELLASAVDKGLSGARSLAECLTDFEQERNTAAMPDYQQNIELAKFQPLSAEVLRIRAAVRGNQDDTNAFLLARQGMIPPQEFFNPENLRRLMFRMGAGA